MAAVHRSRAAAGLTGCLALFLAGCGSSGQPAATTSSPAASSAAESSPAPSSAADASAAGGPTTVTGTVTQGVENTCVVLVDTSGAVVANLLDWNLQEHPYGDVVEATGTFDPGMMTTCQQGVPFEATAVVTK